ncbi:MAG: hypothetical protein ABIY55_18080, partial [Kofleriaceae bacterium]
TNAAVRAALHPLHTVLRTWGGLDEQAYALWSQQGAHWKLALAKTTVVSAELVTAAATGFVAHRLTTLAKGETPDEQTMMSWAIQGATLALAHVINQRLGDSIARLASAGHQAGELVGRLRLQQARAKQVSERGVNDPAGAMQLLVDHQQSIHDEIELWRKVAADPAAAHALGMNPAQVAARLEGAEAHRADVTGHAFGLLPLRFAGLTQEVEGSRLWVGDAEQIAQAIAGARAAGLGAEAIAPTPEAAHGQRVWHVTLGGEPIQIRERSLTHTSQAARDQHAPPDGRSVRIGGRHEPSEHEAPGAGEYVAAPPLTRQERAQLVRAKDLNPRSDGGRLARKNTDDTLALGKRLNTESEGQAILARLATGDASALVEIGVRGLPDNYNPALREFALLETRDGYIIVTGGRRSVDIPHGTRLLGHTHPESLDINGADRTLDLRDEAGSKSVGVTFDEIARDQQTVRAHESGLIPSPADIDAVGDGGQQILHTRYIHAGDGKIVNPGHGATGPRVNILISQVRTLSSNPAQHTTIYEARFTVRAAGEEIWSGTVYSKRVTIGEGQFDQLWFEPPGFVKRLLEGSPR